MLPGATVTLTNDATGVAVTPVSDASGRYLFDFVDPGVYTVTAALDGFKTVQQSNVRVQQRGDVTVDLPLELGEVSETITVEAPPVAVQFNTSSAQLTVERQLLDQTPIPGRNPYNLASLDPTVVVSLTNENRPYHHAYANDYDAGGGTRRANDVLLDGVPLGASYKTVLHASGRRGRGGDHLEEQRRRRERQQPRRHHQPEHEVGHEPVPRLGLQLLPRSLDERPHRPDARDRSAGATPLRGSELRMAGGTLGGPIVRNRIFSFTSFEQWDDSRPLSIVRTVPTELERRGDFSQSMLSGARAHRLQPLHLDARSRHRPRRPHAVRQQRHPVRAARPGGGEDAGGHSAAESPRQRRQLAGQRRRAGQLLEPLAARRRELQRPLQGVRARTASSRPTSIRTTRSAAAPASFRSRAATATA